MENISIASLMICGKPKSFNGNYILSCYDGVWDAVKELPENLKIYFTDDIGNSNVNYGGFLQIVNSKVLDLLGEYELFACFRGVYDNYLQDISVCPSHDLYRNLQKELVFVGWDISTGNGWCTASCDGCYPINPFTGMPMDDNTSLLNQYGLFFNIEDCIEYCNLNNEEVSEYSPWYPVAVYLDKGSFYRLTQLSGY